MGWPGSGVGRARAGYGAEMEETRTQAHDVAGSVADRAPPALRAVAENAAVTTR
jgi:hypothetical protein